LPDQNTKIDLQEKVGLLEKALVREKNAKKKLEEKLEKKNNIKFNENQLFINSFEIATSNQVQLQFLATLTKDLFSTKSLDELLFQFSKNMSNLLDKCPVILIQIHEKDENFIVRLQRENTEWEEQTWKNSYEEIVTALLNSKDSIWHRIEHQQKNDVDSIMSLLSNQTLLYLPLNLTATEQRLMMLDISHYCYNDDFKQTINTAAQQFTLAIKRRATEIELSVNNNILNEIITQLTSTQQQLVHSEKMGSLGKLAAGVAHEINNPIGYISSNLDVLKGYVALYNSTIDQLSVNKEKHSQDFIFAREDIDDLLGSCIDGVQRVTDIVASLKTFSRKEDDDFSSININDVIKSSIKIVWNQFKYAHKITQYLDNNIPNLSGNHGQLQQVFVNLFVNAAQAMKDGGELTVETLLEKEQVIVHVHDTGCGMDESVIRHIFDPFYTTKSVDEGTGLGLSVSFAIVEKHKGIISVKSELNQGCTFTLKFPIDH